MDNKLDDQVVIKQDLLYSNNNYTGGINKDTSELKKDTDKLKNTLKKNESKFTEIKIIIKQMMIHNLHYSSGNTDSPKS